MIKLIDILNEVILSEEIYKDDPNTWTHLTNKDEVIQAIKKSGEWFGVNEDPKDFQYDVPAKTLTANKYNPNVPNFYRGKFYSDNTQSKYLITFKPKQSYPGDTYESSNWEEVDYPLVPNRNRVNRASFSKSGNIGVLKPEYRDIKNFKFYKHNPETDQYEKFNI